MIYAIAVVAVPEAMDEGHASAILSNVLMTTDRFPHGAVYSVSSDNLATWPHPNEVEVVQIAIADAEGL